MCAIAVRAKARDCSKDECLLPPHTQEERAMLNTVYLRDAGDDILSAAALANIQGLGASMSADWTCGYLRALMRVSGLQEHICPSRAAGRLAR